MSWGKVESDINRGPSGLFKWVVIFVVFWVALFGGINLIMKPASVAVDRVVMKNSLQYKEGMEQRAAIIKANIDEIDILIQQNPEEKQKLAAQKRVLASQLRSITINQ